MITPSDIETGRMTPLARDIVALLRERIESGQYKPGERLPSEREICEELKVHRRVVRAATKVLEREGLISRRPNCRPVVRDTPGVPVQRGRQRTPEAKQLSRFVALMMLHGDVQEKDGTGQQRIFWGMNQALGQAGYHTVFLDFGETIGAENEHADRETAHLEYALNQGFGGIIFYCYNYYPNRNLLREAAQRVPLVLIDRELYGVEADFVGITNSKAMYDATNYLLELGHRRIAYITRNEPINPVQDRLQGYLQALRERFTSNYYEMVLALPSTGGDLWPEIDTILQLPADQRPTALVCVNDFEAINVSKRLAQLGLNVPGDISLIGCDNLITKLPSGTGLTTVAQPFEQIGSEAAKLFLRRVASRNVKSEHVECPTKLVIRESCRPI